MIKIDKVLYHLVSQLSFFFYQIIVNDKSLCLFCQLRVVKHPVGDNALHLAARKKDPALVKTLIEAGAQVDTQNNEGQTVLHLACILGDEDTVRVLFMARASPSITDLEDRVPIHLAAERGYSK